MEKRFRIVLIMNILENNRKKNMENNIWIGLVNVLPDKNCKVLKKNEGAFTNILTLANSSEEYRTKVGLILKVYKLHIIEIEDEERLIERMQKTQIDEEIIELSQSEFNNETVKIGTLHIYNLK